MPINDYLPVWAVTRSPRGMRERAIIARNLTRAQAIQIRDQQPDANGRAHTVVTVCRIG
jgi:hypothetical protein